MPERQTYYSKARSLYIAAIKRQSTDAEGKMHHDQKSVQFVPMGDTNLGKFETEDPELIEFMNRRCDEVKDCFRQDKLYENTAPIEEQLARQTARRLDVENQLAAVLAKQGKLPAGAQLGQSKP